MTNQIAFPGLGVNLQINRVAFHIFGHPIYWYALILLAGYIGGLIFVSLTCKKRSVSTDNVWDIAFWGLIFGLLGARTYYVLFDPGCLNGNFLNFFKLWDGGIAIYGAVIGAVLSSLIYCKIKKLPVLNVFDVCAPGLLIGQIIGRWGNFVNAEVYGMETNLPWRMTINGGAGVHPLFLYESLWNLLGLVILLLFRDKKKADGQVFFFYCFWYSLGRLFLEGMRQQEYILYLIPEKLGISQVVAFIGIVVSIAVLIILTKREKKINKE